MTRADVTGPYRATPMDIPGLNKVFSDAFTERYRRDGMPGVRVPALNPAVWRFSLADAADGAMLWRDGDGEIVAFNIAHRSGIEGWMGPLAVRPDAQGQGIGKRMVHAGIESLKSAGALVIGLETMPRTVDNIGFYSSMGFDPGRLTITLTLDGATGTADRIARYGTSERDELLAACAALTERVQPGYDFRREIELTADLGLGDTVVLRDTSGVAAFAVCHACPLVEGRAREELRVLKVVLGDVRHTRALTQAVAAYARESGNLRAAIRVQCEYESVYRAVIAAGARVRWTDLRMTLEGYGEPKASPGVVLSNWEV